MATKITKQDLVEKLLNNNGDVNSKAAATRIVSQIIEDISLSLKEGNDVTITGFGTFKVKRRNARTCRNPRTGDTMQVPAKNVVSFKPGKVIADAVN